MHKAISYIIQRAMAYTQLINRKVLYNFFISSFGSLLLKGLSLFSAPITLRYISPSEYGLLSLANSFTNITAIFLGFGLRQAFSLEFFHLSANEQKYMINDILFVYCVANSLVYFFFILFSPIINHFAFAGAASNSLLYITFFISFFYFFTGLFYQLLQYFQEVKKLMLLQISIACFVFGLQLIFLCIGNLGIISILLAQAIGLCISGIFALYWYTKKIGFSYIHLEKKIQKIYFYIFSGIPFIPTVLFGWILSCGDRWVLAHYTNLSNVGLYAVADSFSQLFNLAVLYPLSCAYLPHLQKLYKKENNTILSIEKWNKKIMWLSMIFFFFIVTIGYFICKPILYYILPPNYHATIHHIWGILCGSIFYLGTYFTQALIQYHKKKWFLACAIAIPALLNIGLNFLLVKEYAIGGCVCATVISYATYFIITFWYNQKLCTKLQTIHLKKS